MKSEVFATYAKQLKRGHHHMPEIEHSRDKKRWGIAVTVILLMILAIQTYHVAGTAISLMRKKVWDNRTRSSLSRGADVSYGQDYMNFIDTLLEEVPADANLYVVSGEQQPEYTSKAYLQYFVLPRILRFCPADTAPLECIQLTGDGSSCYWVNHLPVDIQAAADIGYTTITISENRFLLVPER